MDQLRPEELALQRRRLQDLDDAELQAWMFAALRMSKGASRTWLSRWRWQRRHSAAFEEMMGRAIARMGRGLPLCDRCLERPPTTHVTYGHGDDERYGHFCEECSRKEPNGWLVVAEGRTGRTRRRT